MPVYVCRWENGDFSVVQARSKDDALEMLDEVANAEGMPLYPITDFMVHFQLAGDGTIKLEGFGDDFWYHITESIHPILGKLGDSPHDPDPDAQARIKKAVEEERNRLKAKPSPQPDTELGKEMKAQMDLPTRVINRHIQKAAKEVLKNMKPKGKPN